MRRAQYTVEEDLRTLGLTIQQLEHSVASVPNDHPDVWKERTRVMQAAIKVSHIQTVRTNHPDTNKHADALAKTQAANAAYDRLKTLRIGPRRQPQFIVVQDSWGFSTTASTATATTTFWTTTFRW